MSRVIHFDLQKSARANTFHLSECSTVSCTDSDAITWDLSFVPIFWNISLQRSFSTKGLLSVKGTSLHGFSLQPAPLCAEDLSARDSSDRTSPLCRGPLHGASHQSQDMSIPHLPYLQYRRYALGPGLGNPSIQWVRAKFLRKNHLY